MSEHELQGEVYKGPSGIGRDSPWLTSEDLPADKDVPVTIESVVVYRNVTFQGGRTKPIVLALKFKDKARVLGLNSTNRKVIATLYGNDTASWFGRRIILYVDPDVRFAGKTVAAVRVRAKRMDEKASQVEQSAVAAAREPGGD